MDTLIDALNAAITSRGILAALPTSIAQAVRRSRALEETLCRDVLDEALNGLIQPGNRLELSDGLHAPGEIESTIDKNFCGELDLALCNSSALATFIDLRREGRIRHLHWPDYLLPGPQYLKVEATLKLMALTGNRYIASRLLIEEEEAALTSRGARL
jgi:hypothetical protein